MSKINSIKDLSLNGHQHERGPVLVTGGSGFIGANLAHRLLSEHEPVVLFDNLSRGGVEKNYQWLYAMHGDLVKLHVADIRDPPALQAAVRSVSAVFHFAAQVAVTASLTNPALDFAINAGGTLNVLEALRGLENPPPIVFTSTNKVYGSLREVGLRVNGERYEPIEGARRARGIDENQGLDFYSPYGCSKGTADQYVLDYARTFGLPAVVFRLSCIYGPHQFGTEDQGWVAHFLLRAMQGLPITFYGDGRQVRDILYVEDLVDALLLARRHCRRLSGNAFNIGGGPAQTTSLLELMELIGALEGRSPQVRRAEWRPGDQRYYVSDFRRFQDATGWGPAVSVTEGVQQLHGWLRAERASVPSAFADMS